MISVRREVIGTNALAQRMWIIGGHKMVIRNILISLLIVGLVMYLSSNGKAASDPDLIFYMSSENANGDEVKDDSVNGNTGTLTGDAAVVKDGQFGSALSVGGTGYVDCGNEEILNQEFEGITMELWARAEAFVDIQALAVKWAFAVGTDHIGLFLNGDKALIAVADGVTGENGHTGTKALSENSWIHIAGTWNADDFNCQLYINGELDSEGRQGGSGINVNSDQTLKIGAQVTGRERFFTGLIDEVAIYSRVLTEAEIQRDMQGMFAVQPSGKALNTWASIKEQH